MPHPLDEMRRLAGMTTRWPEYTLTEAVDPTTPQEQPAAVAVKAHAMTPKQRRDIIRAMNKLGLDGNGRFEKVAHGYAKATNVLGDFGIQLQDLATGYDLEGDQGMRTFRLAWDNPADIFAPQPVTNSQLVVSWHRIYTGKGPYEVLAYVS